MGGKFLVVSVLDMLGDSSELFFARILDEILHACLVERQPEDGGERFLIQLGEEMGMFGESGLVFSLQGFELGVNLRVHGRIFRDIELRIGLPRGDGGGLLGLAYDG